MLHRTVINKKINVTVNNPAFWNEIKKIPEQLLLLYCRAILHKYPYILTDEVVIGSIVIIIRIVDFSTIFSSISSLIIDRSKVKSSNR